MLRRALLFIALSALVALALPPMTATAQTNGITAGDQNHDYNGWEARSDAVDLGEFYDNIDLDPLQDTVLMIWGDGTSSYAGLSVKRTNVFELFAAHPYAEEGTYGITVRISGTEGGFGEFHFTAHVSDAPIYVQPFSDCQFTIRTAAGQPYLALLGCPSSDDAADLADLTVTVDWGDGSSSTPHLDYNPDGAESCRPSGCGSIFTTGSHTYARPGQYSVTITYADPGGFTTQLWTDAVVTAADATMFVGASDNPAYPGEAVTFSAVLTGPTGSPSPTGAVGFTLDGKSLGDVPLDGDRATTQPVAMTAGDHQLSATYHGDANYSAQTITRAESVVPLDSKIAVTSSANPSVEGHAVTFTANVGTGPFGPEPAGSVAFSVDGLELDTVRLDAGGVATSPAVTDLVPGHHTVVARYEGDVETNPSQASLDQVVQARAPSVITYTGDTTGQYDDPVAVSARLADAATGAALPGRTVHIAGIGAGCDATTDAHGVAACPDATGPAPGVYPGTASWAGDADYKAATGSARVIIATEETSLSYSGDTHLVNGRPARLAATLKEDGVRPIGAAPIAFTVGTGLSAETCTATTAANGTASCSITAIRQSGVTEPITATFAGDGRYQSAVASLSAPVSVPTTLTADPAIARLTSSLHLQLYAPNLNAHLADNTGAPVPGQLIVFSAAGRGVCQATTDATGTAQCGGVMPLLTVVLNLGYIAQFAGHAPWLASSANGELLSLG